MANNRDDNFEGHEESEYHFSDEEVNYEVESDAPKSAAGPAAGAQKEDIVTRLMQSKRKLISVGVFLVLVFIVYKMVSPSGSTPATDLSATPVVSSQQTTMPATNKPAPGLAQVKPAPIPAAPAPMASAPVVAQPVAPAVQPTTAMAEPPGTNPLNPMMQINAQQANAVAQQAAAAQQALPSLAAAQQQAMQQLNQMQSSLPSAMTQPMVQQPMTQPMAQSLPQSVQQPAPTPPVMASLPGVVPVEPVVPAYNSGQLNAPYTNTASTDARAAMLSANNDQLMNQLQTQYTQKIDDFSSQSKALQDQLQSLSARVSVMENQLNQLVQVLTRRAQNGNGSSMANPVTPYQEAAPQRANVKIAYNVQAIIPGRAWLKSDSGETLTVAEGEMIKDVGRVTKIDPYDGVVEINTGNRSVSLSYGNAG